MGTKLIDHLPWVLPLAVLLGALGYAFWFRELPRQGGSVTGDYTAASELAASKNAPLLLAVDQSPH